MEIPDHLTCLLRNLYAGQEATVRMRHGTTDWFQIGKGVRQGCILSPAYLTYMHTILCKMLGWMKHKLESRLPGEISVTSDLQMTPPFMAEIKEILKNLLMKVKEESGKAGLKVNIQKIKIMASGSITSWQVDGEQWKQWQAFFSWVPKLLWMVTLAMKLEDACSLEGKVRQT